MQLQSRIQRTEVRTHLCEGLEYEGDSFVVVVVVVVVIVVIVCLFRFVSIFTDIALLK